MLEITGLIVFISYIIYLRYYADQRSKAEIEAERLQEGITLYETDQLGKALAYFNDVLKKQSTSVVAYLYRARIYRALGDMQAAFLDLNQAKSYDDTLSDLHLESGQIRYQSNDYTTAFQDFDKAIFHAHGETAEPYRWRGLARQHLQQPREAEQDLAKADQIAQQQLTRPLPGPLGRQPFVNRQWALNAVLTILSALVLVYIIKKSPVIHWPFLWAAASSVGFGFLEPRKGWTLALLQASLIVFDYYVVAGPDQLSTHREVELFSLYGSVGLTFVGSLIGSVLKKAYSG